MLSGKLSRPIFAGPPEYEDIRKGDAPEPAYILTLGKHCLPQGDDFDTDTPVDQVHIIPSSNDFLTLMRLIGEKVLVSSHKMFGWQPDTTAAQITELWGSHENSDIPCRYCGGFCCDSLRFRCANAGSEAGGHVTLCGTGKNPDGDKISSKSKQKAANGCESRSCHPLP
jgi:hypothetical protein